MRNKTPLKNQRIQQTAVKSTEGKRSHQAVPEKKNKTPAKTLTSSSKHMLNGIGSTVSQFSNRLSYHSYAPKNNMIEDDRMSNRS